MHIKDIKFCEDGETRVTLGKMLDWMYEWFIFSQDGVSRFDLPTKDMDRLQEIAGWRKEK